MDVERIIQDVNNMSIICQYANMQIWQGKKRKQKKQ
jgi:hypothetical protein